MTAFLLSAVLYLAGSFCLYRVNAIRFATFDVNFRPGDEQELLADLEAGNDTQAQALAHILQIVRPDVILLNKFD